ncbi:hypothetical protein EYF80_056633 [Liparis tanakae]|uniref:Uncharacterized protein n=1 Tax=Liparis tanakae TaxID=230148 RepID=A0A4Z2EWF0_9TELE|nr:hypothetical protein EYF80_056633 [Liparis tanakae]
MSTCHAGGPTRHETSLLARQVELQVELQVTFYLLRYATRRDGVTCCCGEHRAEADRGSLPLPRQRASISCELTSRKSHIWLESQRFYDA